MGNLVPYNLVNIEEEARKLVREAQERARTILTAAMQEAERIRSDAREAGEAEGLQAGREAGEQQGYDAGIARAAEQVDGHVVELEQTLHAVLQAWEQEFRWLRQAAEQDLVRLAFRIAETVLDREVETYPETVLNSIEKAVQLALDAKRLEIHVNPADQALADQFFPMLKSRFTELDSVNLIGDESVDRGGAVVKTAQGSVDARITTQFQEIRRALLGENADDSDTE
jgi:flagellar assembly protein FliH